VARQQASITRGHSAEWTVIVSAIDGNVSGVDLHLSVSPSSQSAKFTFGCKSGDGTASCDLGTVDSSSAARQLSAQVAVADSATSVKSVTLTATGSSKVLTKKPQASAAVAVSAPVKAKPAASGPPTQTPPPSSATPPASTTTTVPPVAPGVSSTLGVGSLPFLNSSGSSSLSPGGNASGLFPTLSPSSASSSGSQPAAVGGNANARPVADTSALPEGSSSVIGAQLVGLGALALAFILAVTRLSVRRRSTPKPPGGDAS
jgi:hypothetical protein